MSSPAIKPIDPSDPSAYAPKWLRERSIAQRRIVQPEIDDQSPPRRPAPPLQPESPPPLRPAPPQQPARNTPDMPMNLVFLPLQREDHLRELERTLSVLKCQRMVEDDLLRPEGPPIDPGRAWTPRPIPALGERRQGNACGGNMYIEGFRVPRSLEPQRLPPPPTEPRSPYVRRAISLLIMSGVAAPLAYFAAVGWDPAPPRSESAAAVSVDIASMIPVAVKQALLISTPAEPETKPVAAVARTEIAAETIMARPVTVLERPAAPPSPQAPQASTVGSAPPIAEQAASPREKMPLRQLDPDEIALLMNQGEQFIAAGDLVTARIVFRRAAETGDARAALALGATYDPALLARLGIRSVSADADQARNWYERAKDFGSSEATRRLEMLASR